MLNLFESIIDDGITPNGLYFLLKVSSGKIPSNDMINYHVEKRLLENSGYIVENKISEKSKILIEKYRDSLKFNKPKTEEQKNTEKERETYINAYREIFPKGVLPSGSAARCSVKDLEKRFKWFFENYNYNWDTILKATKKYVDTFKDDDYKYMKTSGYFIVKNEKGMTSSTLETYCQMILESPTPEETDSYVKAI